MQNVYISSTIYSFRTKPSLFNDYSYLLNERFDRNPIRTSLISTPTSCCCDCCAFLTPRVPISPCYLYGLRQSGYRRLRLGLRDRVCDPGPGCYELSCSVKERSYVRSGRRGKGRCSCVEEESEVCDLGGFGELEALLCLLSEEVSEECFGREKNGFKRVEEENRRNLGGSRRDVSSVKRVEDRGSRRNESLLRRVEAERGSFVGREKGESLVEGGGKTESVSKGVQVDFEEGDGVECRSGEKRSGGRYSYVESDTKQRLESSRVESSEKDSRQKEETGRLLKGEHHRGRKEGSSSSSYYSVSSGEYGNEANVKAKHDLLEEPGSSVYKDSQYDRGRFYGRVSEEYMYRRDDAEAKSEISRQRNTAVEGGAMWDWRKKSEKKLMEEVTEETRATKKSSEMHSRVVKTNESEFAKASGSQKQFDDERENSYLIQVRKEQYSQTRNQDVVEAESIRRFQEGKKGLEVHRTDAETKSQSQKRVSDREQNLAMATNVVQETRDEHYKRTGHTTQREKLNIDIQKLTGVSQVEVVDSERTSNWWRQSDTRTNQKENTNMGLISVETEERLHQLGHQVDQKAIQRAQSKKGTNDVAEMSSVHESNTARSTNSQRTSDKRSSNQESVTVLAATSVQETMQGKEAQSSRKVTTFQEKGSEEPSSVQASSSMVSQARMQRGDVEGHKRSPQTPLLPPPPQLIARGSARIELSSETASQEVSEETSQSNSALNYESCGGNSNTETPAKILYPTNPEDALGSAHRSEDSSSQFVGEFFEKISYGVSTPENQTVHEASTSSQYVSEDSRLKRNESRRLSGGSGTKGPSVEMWEDVTETSTLKSPEEEKAEATITSEKPEVITTSEKAEATTGSEKSESTTTSGNALAKRTGRSIWNVVAYLVKLRWTSQTETPCPAIRLGERNSSNESASSEAWFSGRETGEVSEKNVKQEKGMQPETTSDQLQPVKSFSRSEKASGSVKSKDKVRYVETGTTSSPDKEESRLTSQSVSLSSNEETLSPKDYQKNSQGSSSGIQIVGSSQSKISSGVKSPVFLQRNKQVLKARSDDESDNVQMGGELIQRKLQRNKQVPEDRFDEWEEAQNREIEQRKIDEMFMREALLEAKKAADTWEVPVGAVLVQHGKIIARGHNLVEELRDSTAHAEMICIREASNVLRTWRLAESTLYITLEPCPMCAGAILQARVDTVVWGAPNKLLGADGSWIRIFPDSGQGNEPEQSGKPAAPVHPFHPNMTIRRGVLAAECADTMQQFFYLRRRKKEKRQATSPAPPSTRAVSHHPRKLLTKLHDIFHIMFCL